MMKFRVAVLCLAAVGLLLSGCKSMRGLNSCHKPQPYMSAKTGAPLQIPAGLDGPRHQRQCSSSPR